MEAYCKNDTVNKEHTKLLRILINLKSENNNTKDLKYLIIIYKYIFKYLKFLL